MSMSSAPPLFEIAPTRAARLLSDMKQFDGSDRDERPPVFDRLAAALGHDFAERIVVALSADALDRLDSALNPAFAERLRAVLAKERDGGLGPSDQGVALKSANETDC